MTSTYLAVTTRIRYPACHQLSMLYQKLYESAIDPLYSGLMRDGANAGIREIDRNAQLGRSELAQVTHAKIQRLLVHARAKVPFYKTLPNGVPIEGSIPDCIDAFKRIPKLSR